VRQKITTHDAIRGGSMDTREVHIAFEMLVSEIDAVIKNLKQVLGQAVDADRFDEVRHLSQAAGRVQEIRRKVEALWHEWEAIFSGRDEISSKPSKRRGRRSKERLERGVRTPESAYRRPILEALVELGGSARVGTVLDLVEKKMSGILNDHDYEFLVSGKEIRWRNAAMWCRDKLVREGLMKRDSPKGIWEVSEEGRRWLQINQEG